MQDIRNLIDIAETRVAIAIKSQMAIVLAELFLLNMIKLYDQF